MAYWLDLARKVLGHVWSIEDNVGEVVLIDGKQGLKCFEGCAFKTDDKEEGPR